MCIRDRYEAAAAGDTTRMLIAGGETNSGNTGTIQYVAMPVGATAVTFGSLYETRKGLAGTADDTYSVFGGGWTSFSRNTIDYVTTQTTGNASSFGSLSTQRNTPGACTDGIKGCWVGGYRSQQSSRVDRIDYVTIANTSGNATDFGGMSDAGNSVAGVSGNAA